MQHPVFDSDLPDVVEQGPTTKRFAVLGRQTDGIGDLHADGGDSGRMTERRRVASVDDPGERFHAGEVGLLERRRLLLQASGHLVEGFCQVTDLIA